MELRYAAESDGVTREVVESLRLEELWKPFGGYVWVFRCPILVAGVPCNRTVVRLTLRHAAGSRVGMGAPAGLGVAARSALQIKHARAHQR